MYPSIFLYVKSSITVTTDPSAKDPEINDSDEDSLYDNPCKNKGVRNAMRIIGYVIFVVKILAPLMIIIFGMIDFGKAVTSNDEAALSKATAGLIRRIIAGVAIFFIPTLLLALLNILGEGEDSIENTQSTFKSCTKCVLDVSQCSDFNKTDSGGSTGNFRVDRLK